MVTVRALTLCPVRLSRTEPSLETPRYEFFRAYLGVVRPWCCREGRVIPTHATLGAIVSGMHQICVTRRIQLGWLFAPLLALGCSSAPMDVLSHPLESGGTLGQRVPRNSSSVVLVIDHNDVVTCGTHVSRWMEWGRANPGKLTLVLKEAPDEAARRQLLLYRINPDAVLRRSRAANRLSTPAEYLVMNGRVVFSEPVAAGTPVSPLLKAVEMGGEQVAGLLEANSAGIRKPNHGAEQ